MGDINFNLGQILDLTTIDTSSCAPLAAYTERQLRCISPSDDRLSTVKLLTRYLPTALRRLRVILDRSTASEPDAFDPLHSLQYATYLYLIANEIFLGEGQNVTSERLFLLNRCLNAIDLYYKIPMPPVFVIEHGLGSVLVNTRYGNNFVFFHNVTVGRIGSDCPVIGENVILYPGSGVFGRSTIGNNSVISAGTIVSNQVIPANSIVFNGGGSILIKPRRKDYIHLYIRGDQHDRQKY